MRRVPRLLGKSTRELYLNQPDASSSYRNAFGEIDPYHGEEVIGEDSSAASWEDFPDGWDLIRTCAGVIRSDVTIVLYQIISVVICVTALYLFLIALFASTDLETVSLNDQGPEFAFQLFAYYFFAFMVLTFFNAASVVVATIRLRGGDPVFRDGIEAASGKLLPIFQWAGISAVVGVLLVALRSGTGESVLFSAIFGFIWSVVTYFVVPILLFEEEGPIYASSSSFLMVSRIGRRALDGNGWRFYVLIAFGLLGLTVMLPAGVLLGGPITVVLPMIVLLSALGVFASTFNSVLAAIMYGLARTGEIKRPVGAYRLMKMAVDNMAEDLKPQPEIVDESKPHVETSKYINRMRKS